MAGDFTGDGRVDYALYLRTAGHRGADGRTTEHTIRFVVFVAVPGGAFAPQVIRESRAVLPLHERLELQRPGRIREVDGAASTFFWEPRTRTFRSIATGD